MSGGLGAALRRAGLALLGPAIAVVFALVVSALVVALIGEDPFEFLSVMFNLGDTPAAQVQSIVVILNRAIPLFLSGLAVSIGFRMGLFNIGVEGQYRLATLVAAAAGAAVTLPAPLHVLFVIVVAIAVGAGWAGIAAVLKVTRGVSEVISSIMLNAIALGLAAYLLTGPFLGSEEGSNIVNTTPLPDSAHVPPLTGLLTGLGLEEPRSDLYGFLLIALVVGVAVAVLLSRTRFGFDLRATGLSPSAASASGVNARTMTVKAMLLSGAVAGLVGLPELLGSSYVYSTEFTAGLGFLGIAVALLGKNSPGGIAVAALLFAFLDRAALPLQFADIPSSVITIIQGTIVLAVVVANEIARRLALRSAERGAAAVTGEPPDTGGGGGPVAAGPAGDGPDGGHRVRTGLPGTEEPRA
ncbi:MULTISPECIES: ABC transporter permease [unclassified Blastococcus]